MVVRLSSLLLYDIRRHSSIARRLNVFFDQRASHRVRKTRDITVKNSFSRVVRRTQTVYTVPTGTAHGPTETGHHHHHLANEDGRRVVAQSGTDSVATVKTRRHHHHDDETAPCENRRHHQSPPPPRVVFGVVVVAQSFGGVGERVET
ncbi:unnamed protein product [Macrosiphum euphorbiae]|uniref:Secreted protein n=1 Tax=Macrosiphum euphorbiae TaxID=13131 RepID=A0AAV0VU90_9HEMI|nr:unnamed protein product [Macrosiphum euphorbiae]